MKVGILGGGQLGRMLAMAGHPIGHECVVLSPSADCPAAAMTEVIEAPYDDPAALDELVRRVEVVTYEFENVPTEAVEHLRAKLPVRPGLRALEVAGDRLNEKQLFQKLGIPTVPFAPVSATAEMDDAVRLIGLPAVLKTRRFGYDGKGQRVLFQGADVEGAFAGLGRQNLLLEGFIDFKRELSIVAVRGVNGDTKYYPLVENQHEDGILRVSRAPAPHLPEGYQAKAEGYAASILDDLAYVGVLALELFDTGSELLANEIAPRVHNSGHWTIEGAEVSQFENHLRAVTGMPLGSTAPVGESAMVNLIGELPSQDQVLSIPGAHLHLYGKEPRPGRKLGHVTVQAPDSSALDARLEAL